MLHRISLCLLAAVVGCAPASEETSSTTTSTSPAGSTSTGSTGTQSTTTGPAKPVLHASFVAEEKPGDAPALLRMYNDTPDQILSLTLDDNEEYTFYLIEPLTASDHEITTSDDLLTDAILSIHTTDSCVRKPFAEMTGPLVLEPGHAYSIHVSIEDGFSGLIVEDPMPDPYIGVRALVKDPAGSQTPTPAELVLSTGNAPPGEITYNTIFTEFPEPYVHVAGPQIDVESIRFVDRAGVAHGAWTPIVLQGSYGYTVHVDDQIHEDAEIDVPLEELLQ